jgi:hypothetical protein
MKTNYQDPGTSEIRSTQISGMQEAVGKLEDSIGMESVAEAGIELSHVFTQYLDPPTNSIVEYRIYQAPAGKRNWVASPTPVIKKNDVIITEGFTFDYAGGAIIVSPSAIETDAFTADATYIAAMATSFKTHLAEDAFKVTINSGLTLDVNAGKLLLQDSTWFEFAGGQITIPNNVTSEIVIDLYKKELHALPRAIHSGCIHIASVTASSGAVTAIKKPASYVMPTSNIERTKRKMSVDRSYISIAVLGDSLSVPDGTGTPWTDLLFSATYAANGYNVNLATKELIIDNYAVGSQTSRYGLALLGEAYQTNEGVQYGNAQIKYKQYTTPKYFESESCEKSPLANRQYDLAIVGFGMNGGTDKMAFLENIVRILRKQGTEVIIITQNNQTINETIMYDDGFDIKVIADVYGCDVADTWSFVREAQLNGLTVHADTTHMSADGHIAYAKALRSVFNDLQQGKSEYKNPNVNLYARLDNQQLATKFPKVAEILFDPYNHTGARIAGTVTDPKKNPAILFGGKTSSNYILELQAGEYAYFGHPHVAGVDLLCDWGTAFTADIKHNSGLTVLATVNNTFSGLNRVGLNESVPIPLGSTSDGSPSYLNKGFRIDCVTGTLRLVGVVCYTFPNKEILPSEMEFIGTYAEEAWSYAHPYSKYSDTDGDSLIFKFKGIGCQLLFNGKSAAGKIDVWLDGKKIHTALDLYGASNSLYPLELWTNKTTDAYGLFDRGEDEHVVKIKLNGVNASAISPVATNRRLAFLAGYIFTQ